jgi:hypothetical protein
VFRTVYGYGRGRVLKVNSFRSRAFSAAPRSGYLAANQREWHVWTRVQGTSLEPYFARAYGLTPAGDLIMHRATRVCKEYACARPTLDAACILDLTDALDIYDAACENIGLIRGVPVILDYQLVDLRRLPTGIKMVEAWNRA